ncbi:hypothetical protein [Flavisolibacter ginsenosidimutans]|uniref:Right-handed parallel beta-helix repeat-containing protein n=1 Tax=Flavisolibacter ginsenosidimutans TaxID=661481 RepID=A0A5B8UJB5_9BACT|nr:hypothetical protein [Flavisolibacter ginsenosidimutans]QEC56492.1 hypothetical protein FSB75_11495 [Flavisolibacter ginsenosidimutans]
MKKIFSIFFLFSLFSNGQQTTRSFVEGSYAPGGALVTNLFLAAACSAPPPGTLNLASGFQNRDVYAASFGFLPSASAAQNTKAMQRISDLINGLSGGITLHIEKGNYTVGTESFAGTKGKGYSYIGQRLLNLHGCTKPVVVDGHGATIRLKDGMHFGSFDPAAGLRHDALPGGFTIADYRAYPCTFFWFENNKSIEIKNLLLDGNAENLIVGGYWGDVEIQLEADGIAAFYNGSITVSNVNARHFGRDGLMVGNSVTDTTKVIKQINIDNFVGDGCSRNAFSWTGGNHLRCTNSSFINGGQVVNRGTGKKLITAPNAGVDIEAELGLIKNGLFESIYVGNTARGVGIVNDNAVATSDVTIRNAKIVAVNGPAIYGLSRRMLWENCTIIGSSVALKTAGSTGPDDPNNATFKNCLFTMDTALSPSGKVYGTYVLDLGAGGQATFRQCTFNSAHRGTVYGGYDFSFYDCTFLRDSAAGSGVYPLDYMNGRFYGVNKKVTPYPEGKPYRSEGSKLNGPFYENGVDVRNLKPGESRKAAIRLRAVAGGYEATYNDRSKETIQTVQVPTLRPSCRKQTP